MYNAYIVRRTQIYLADHQDRLVQRRAESTGTTKSAVIRDAIDAFLTEDSGARDAELQRFRAAVAQAAGVAPYLPPGSSYVETMRAADSDREHALRERRRQ